MSTLTEIKQKRNRRVDLESTPPAIFLNTDDIAVDTNGGGLVIDFTQQSKTEKMYPFSVIAVNNNSDSDLNVYVNQRTDWQKICRANTILTIKDFKGIRSVRISKRDATVTITAGQVEVNVERPALNEDERIRREVNTPGIIRIIKNKIGLGV